MQTYTTISGDTWDIVALKTLGSEYHMDKVIRANLQHRYVRRFAAGVVLQIPDLPLQQPDALPPWKRGQL